MVANVCVNFPGGVKCCICTAICTGMGKGGVTEVWLHLGNQTAFGGNCYKQIMAASLFHWARTKQIPHSVKGETLHSCF